ncbi:hypothetical protein BRC92_02950 [Halobacteriales archaeon QS_4_69_31]|nr:MAG: hypothetical protein BRC92_02950 [Halobacteriales archaeon QS_4_69_31]
MRRWSARRPRAATGRRGQLEPFAALAAVAVVALALAVFAGAFEASVPGPADRDVTEPTADRVERALTVGGVVRPGRLDDATAAAPGGYRLNVTLHAGGDRWATGPSTPPTAENASRRVSVFRDAGVADAGRLEVRVWT